jgi:MFS family permease
MSLSSAATPGTAPRASDAAGWYAVAILWLAYICSFVDRQVLALLVDPIKLSLGIGDTQVSLLQGFAFGLFYALMGVPCGALVDRYDRRLVVACGIALWSLATMACGVATGFWLLFGARMLVGIGEATLSPGALSLLSDLFPRERRVLPLSIYVSAGSFGSGLAMLVGGAAVAYLARHPLQSPFGGTLEAWRAAFVLVGAPGLAIALLLRTVREPPRNRGDSGDGAPQDWSRAWNFMVERRDLFLRHYGGLSLYSWLAYSILSWAPANFMRVHGWTLPQTGLRFGLTYLVAGTLGAVAGGAVATQLRRRHVDGNLRTAALALTAIVVPAIAAPLVGNAYLSLALYGAAIFCTSFPSGASATAITEVTPDHLRGQVSAYYYLAMTVVGLTFGPLSVALLTDYVFHDPKRVGASLAIVAALVAPPAAWLAWSALRPFRQWSAPPERSLAAVSD